MNQNPYKSPDAALVSDISISLPLWVRILGNLYFWPKLCQYAVRFFDEYRWATQGNESIVQFLEYALNIPAYFACFFYLFNFKVFNRRFWQIYTIVAISDEAYLFSTSWRHAESVVFVFILLAPLYIMAVNYAFLQGTYGIAQPPQASNNHKQRDCQTLRVRQPLL